MKKILVFAAYYWPHKGGHEKYVQELCERLATREFKIDVVTSLLPGTKKKEIWNQITIYRFPVWNILGGTYPVPRLEIIKLFKWKNYSVVITNTRFFLFTFVGLLFSAVKKTPHLHIEHGSCHPKISKLIYPIAVIYDHLFGYIVLRFSTFVACVSVASQNFVDHIFRRKTYLLYNSIDTSFFSRVSIDRKWKGIIVTYVGRLIENKGVQDLIEAVRGIDNVTVLVVGKGNYEKKLRSVAGESVKFLDEKNHTEIRDILSQTDIFVNPSYSEGLPTSVLEAGSMGVAIIATDVGGTKEIIENNISGFLVIPKDIDMLRNRLLILIKNAKLRKRMGMLLQKKVHQNFDWEITSNSAQKLLNGIGNEEKC